MASEGWPSPARRRSRLRVPVVVLLLTALAALCWHPAPVDAARAKRHPKRPKEEALAVPKEPRRVPKEEFERQRPTSSRANSTASGRHGRSLLQVRTELTLRPPRKRGGLTRAWAPKQRHNGLVLRPEALSLSPPRRPRRLRLGRQQQRWTRLSGLGQLGVSSPCSTAMGWAGWCRRTPMAPCR
jgi:hypothetical protein